MKMTIVDDRKQADREAWDEVLAAVLALPPNKLLRIDCGDRTTGSVRSGLYQAACRREVPLKIRQAPKENAIYAKLA